MLSTLVKKMPGPLSIKNLRELWPGFPPKWVTYEIGMLVAAMVWFFALVALLPLIGGIGLARYSC
ncbi:hypothetical protein ROG8370_02235 [Roseovarius gaetbuli]|uniref:Uncharacterized protein n=1 Tax=Roseovarius gaetbuli TaxID=1356575 RepID=A0A1X6ZIE6_9RHOB|nr:hypothetical protein ROG8370_02235 [Roseovarius gaetbuli]